MYQLLTGRLPFQFTAPLELIHAHIAKSPSPPEDIVSDIPKQLSDMVMKLLAKNAEDRYQSINGLRFDLEECQRQIGDKGYITPFKLGKNDFTEKFVISEKLYGRSNELTILLDAFDRITSGPLELVYVYGYSGIGKTRLIEELQKGISQGNGFYATGKFDQFHRDTPYYAFSQAFNSLVYQMLAEDSDQVARWQSQFEKALEGNGQVLLEVVPDLELLLGKQSEVYDLGYQENKERFQQTILDFLSVLDRENRPLTFFIDDLQWADSSSLELIHHLLTSNLSNILLIGSFRDNEVDSSHPLTHHIRRQKQETPAYISEIKLKELDLVDINQFIADSLKIGPEETLELSELIVNKTQGNPFFTKQFLYKLIEENYIRFAPELPGWKWELNEISNLDITDNVVDLVVNKIQKLPAAHQEVISLAACIGNTVELETLLIIANLDEEAVSEAIWDCVKHGFIRPTGSWTRYYSDSLWQSLGIKTESAEGFHFKFQHDKIQQAAYTLIAEKDVARTHLKIGELLLKNLSEAEIEEQIFDILDHLNQGFEGEVPASWKEKLAALNYRAGIRAKNSAAIDTAIYYLKFSMELYQDEAEKEIYKLALIARSECEYLLGNFNTSESLFDQALQKVVGALEKADIISRKMLVYENTHRQALAITAARDGLALLGTDLPYDEDQDTMFAEFGTVQQMLSEKSTDELLNNKLMDDPRVILTVKILMNLWGPLYLLAKRNLLAFMILRMVRLSNLHGNSKESALAYAFYGYLISAQMHQFEEGFAYAMLGEQLNKKLNDKSLRSKVLVIAYGCVGHWKLHFGKVLPGALSAYEYGVETNDLIYAGYGVSFATRSYFLKGDSLEKIYEIFNDYIAFCHRIKLPIAIYHSYTWQRTVIELTGFEPHEKAFREYTSDKDYHAKMLSFREDPGMTLVLANHYITQAMLFYFMGDFDKGLEYLEEALPYLPAVLGLAENGEFYFYYLLHYFALANRKHGIDKRYQGRLEEYLGVTEKMALSCPDNYEARWLLIQAERHVLEGDRDQAADNFLRARESAVKYNALHYEALILERMADFAFSSMDIEKGAQYVAGAIFNYQKWGAHAKVKQLQHKVSSFAPFIERKDRRDQEFAALDLQSVMDASTTISGEVVYSDLLHTS